MHRFRLGSRTALLVLALATPSASAGDVTSPETGSKPIPTELAGLRDRWTACMDDFCIPGMAIVVVRDDKVIYLDTFGYRDVEKKLPVTPDTTFYIASATKPFTTMGLMTLVEAGMLKLDDPVQKVLKQFELPDADAAKSLTVRDLLCHRRGVNCGQAVLLDAYTGEITDDRYFRMLRQQGRVNGNTEYTNIHFTLAGRVIEALTGHPWRDYLATSIFTPAGLTTATGYADAMYARKDVAIPYELGVVGFSPTQQRKTDATMHAAGGLGISISDLGRWLRLNINGGEIDGKRIISVESAAEMLKLQSERPEGKVRVLKGFGLGWMVGTFRPDGPRYMSHGGGYIGAGAHTSFLPDRKIGVAIVTNAAAPAAVFADQVISIDIYDRLLGNKPMDLIPNLRQEVESRMPRIRKQAENAARVFDATGNGAFSLPLDQYVGEYRNADFGTFHVARRAVQGATGTTTTFDMKLGEMCTKLVSSEKDVFTVDFQGDPQEGKFEIEAGKVNAVSLETGYGNIRFERK